MQLSIKQTIFVAVTSFVSMALFFSPQNRALYDLLMFPCPDPRTPDITQELDRIRAANIDTREVQFKSSNGRVLHGMFFGMPGTKKVIFYCHGKGNNIYCQFPKVRMLLGFGASVFMYDYQGFGKSQGRVSIEGSCEDALAAYDYLIKEENRSGKDIIAFGQSFGSGVVGQLAAQRELGGVVIHSGFASLVSAGRDTFFWLRWYPAWAFPQQRMDNIAVFSKPHPPLLIVHGTTDQILSYRRAAELFEKSAEPKAMLTLPNGHSSFGKNGEFIVAMRKFMQDLDSHHAIHRVAAKTLAIPSSQRGVN